MGGGPAGSAAAITLVRAGVEVTMQWLPSAPVGESLVPSAQQLLRELGAWDRFLADEHLPCYGNASRWGSDELAYTDFIRSPYGHGWHLDRARFDASLREVARDAGVEIREERWDGNRDCDWLVDCGGRAAPVARAFGIEKRYDDNLIAFFARLDAGDDEQSITLVESAPDGWFHTALLPGRERIVTYFTDTNPTGRRPAHVHARDARTGRLARFHGDGWIAAGDAALSFDPLSSQGILSALYGGVKAAEAIVSGELDAYDAAMEELYARFLQNRATYYGYEQRWRDRPFWMCRGFSTRERL